MSNPDRKPASRQPVAAINLPQVGGRGPSQGPGQRRRQRSAWRPERIAWAAVWAVSVFVIVIHLLDSFSQPEQTQVAAGVRSNSPGSATVWAGGFSAELLATNPEALAASASYRLSSWPGREGAGHSGPAVLSLENAVPGATYTFAIRCRCAAGGGSTEDAPGEGHAGALFAPPSAGGPGTSVPDATLAPVGGPSRGALAFQLWGGAFSAPVSVGQSTDCDPAHESVRCASNSIVLTALARTLHLLIDPAPALQPD